MKQQSRHFRKLALSLATLFLLVGIASPSILVHAQDGGTTTLPISHRLDINQIHHEYQGWNNCGPTTLTMSLSYFGYNSNQQPAANYLKPHREDKNVSPWELVQYTNEEVSQTNNVNALVRIGGNLQLLKSLLAADFPVIVEKGFEPEGEDWMGHYLFLIGYDDTQAVFLTYDSYLGHGNFQGLHESYEHMETYWWHFSNTFIVLYAPEREAELMEILGDLADPELAFQQVAMEGQRRVQEDETDAWSWFNIGDALTQLGQYDQAAAYFRIAFERHMPWRTLWYRHTPLEAYYQSGNFQTVLELVNANLLNTPYVEEWYYYRGLVFASQGRIEDARAQMTQALVYNSRFEPAHETLTALDDGTFIPVTQVAE